MQKTKDGRRVIWLGHEAAPKNFTAIDVTDPTKPKMIIQTELPHAKMRSNSLEVFGDKMYVAHQIRGERGMTPGRFRHLGHQHARAAEEDLAFRRVGAALAGRALRVDRWTASTCTCPRAPPTSSRAIPRTTSSTASSTCAIRRSPWKSGRWWYPGSAKATPRRRCRAIPSSTAAIARTTSQVYPQRPDRAYVVLHRRRPGHTRHQRQVASPKEISRFNYSPPFNGFTHTVMPLFEKQLLIVSDECTKDDGEDWPKPTWVFDMREEKNPVPIATLPLPPVESFGKRGGRYGSHNLYENYPGPVLVRSETSSSPRSSTAACAPTISPTRSSRARSPISCPARRPVAQGRGPDQRRVLGRPGAGLRRRSLYRRAIRAGDDDLGE